MLSYVKTAKRQRYQKKTIDFFTISHWTCKRKIVSVGWKKKWQINQHRFTDLMRHFVKKFMRKHKSFTNFITFFYLFFFFFAFLHNKFAVNLRQKRDSVLEKTIKLWDLFTNQISSLHIWQIEMRISKKNENFCDMNFMI